MIEFKYLDIPTELKDVLTKYKIDFAFQPIYFRNKTLYGYEALMRPEDVSITDLLETSREKKTLHDLELLSFFGGTLAYGLRGYTKKLCINSIPSECLTQIEYDAYWRCFEHIKKQLVVELVESADYENWNSRVKESQIENIGTVSLSIDDFGTGNNDITRIRQMSPKLVKLDKSLISNINSIQSLQKMVDQLIYSFHEMGIQVLAEGVETKEEYDYLQTTDIDLYQGYYLGRPN